MWDLLKQRWLVLVGALLLAVLAAGWTGSRVLAAMKDAAFWESTIRDFEEQDQAKPPSVGGVLFTGSSSIRMWSSLASDMAPLAVINRGFGGSHISHVSHYVSRIVHPYRPSAVVLYAGDNDLSDGTGKTAESVTADFKEFVALVREELPKAPVYFVAIKPSLLRWDRWPVMKDANERIAAWAATTAGVEYLDIATPMLDRSGKPQKELFGFDGLHLSKQGYELWTRVIRPILFARHRAG